MMPKRITTVSIAFAVAMVPATRVAADGGDFAAGIIAGVVGSAVVRDIQKKNQAKKQTTRNYNTGISSAQREQNRQVQTALNYFAFPVGTPDGSIGPRSRAAISQYQATLGYPATGQLTDYERDFLLNSFYRAQAGGAVTAQAIASNPMGVQGLLIDYRNQMTGNAAMQPQVMPQQPYVQPQGQMALLPAAPQQVVVPQQVLVPDSAPQGQMAKQPDASAMPATQLVMQSTDGQSQAPVLPSLPVAAPAALPSFLGQDGATTSLAGQCATIGGQSMANGGVTPAAAVNDPSFALSEQFCMARQMAIGESDKLAKQVSGFTPGQIMEQCKGFGPVLKDYVAALAQQTEAEVLERVSGFALSSGMKPQQMSGTARTCLGLGYAADDVSVALGSALVLTGLGEMGYAELVGYHLAEGYGVTARPDLAVDWYDAALAATTPAFAAAGVDRMAVIRVAVDKLAGRPGPATQAVPEVVPAMLPTFSTGGGAPAAPATSAPATTPGTVSP